MARAAGGAVIIAVDGPTASGKGTIARRLAEHYGLPWLDTGLLYRAVGRQCQLSGTNPDDPADALAAANAFPDHLLADPQLRSEETGGLASRVSIHPAVRQALFERQRQFATQPGGAVLDGRDIGTVIAPDADVKLFVTASVDARTYRRWQEMHARGIDVTREAIAADIRVRDARDSGRANAPLRQAAGAVLIDNSDMTRDEAFAAALAAVETARSAPSPALTLREFEDSLAGEFHDINAEWIEAMFTLEATDRETLENPRAAIIDPGGAILFVEAAGRGIVGACALQKTGPDAFELTKMGVRENARGLKAGEFLLAAMIDRARTMGAKKLYLLTNRKCAAAIHLYEKLGFVHDPSIGAEYGTRYARCDVAMRFRGEGFA